MKECCGNCIHIKRDFSKPQNQGYIEFCCGNEESSEYGVPTFYDDTCDCFEEKEITREMCVACKAEWLESEVDE